MQEILDKIKYNQKILIEASAGTGKTYTLENTITSLLINKIYSPNEVLVLTFTKKATEEMYIRILKSIENAYNNSKTDKLLKEIYEQSNKIFISTIHKFALHSLNNFQIETGNFYQYRIKENLTSEIDEIVYEFLRKEELLKKELAINHYEFETFKSYFANTEEMIRYIKKIYKRDKTKELGDWIEKQTIFQNILINKDKLIYEYNSIIEELNTMTIEEKRIFLNKHNQGSKISEIKYKNEQDIVKITETLINNQFLHKIITSNINKSTTLSEKEIWIKKSLINLNHKTNIDMKENPDTKTPQRSNLRKYIKLNFEYKILKYIERELVNTINVTNTIDQKHIMLNFKSHLESPSKSLLNSIKSKYKIILIDESQDLDLIQIEIFKILNSCGIKLIFIADPKQIIYGFRNADVSFYNQRIKDKIKEDAKITLGINYRSNKKLVEPLNIMFSNIYNKTKTSKIEQIEFISSKTNPKNDNNNIFINDKEIEGINIIETDKGENTIQKTALTIKYLLTNGKIYDNEKLRKIKKCDIAVLCRTSKEINLIDKALQKQGIKTNKTEKSFFNTKEFNEIFYLIKCLDRKQEFKTLSYVLTSKIINLPWELYLNFVERDEIHYIEEFISEIIYLLENKQITIIKAIDTIISNKDSWINLARIFNNPSFTEFAITKKSYRETLINEEKFEELNNYEASIDFISKIYHQEKDVESLISTLETLITNKDFEEDEDNTNIKDSNSIEILTIHKSKGLSLNIVFLIGDIQDNKSQTLLKSSETFYKFCSEDKIEYDFLKLKKNQAFASLKFLNEEKNLFYVGTTRARFALFIINKGKIINIMLTLSEIKKIEGINLDFNVYNLIKTYQLNQLDMKHNTNIKLIKPTPINKNLFRKEYTHSYTSLSSLNKSSHNINKEIIDDADYNNDASFVKEILPKGKDTGNIFHAIMEEINFKDAKGTFVSFQKKNISLIQKKIKHFNSNLNTYEIQETFTQMIYNILNTKIKLINARLCDIQELQKEMEFLIRISNKTNKQKKLFISYKDLDLNLNEGYIKGIIDLIFKINNKVYILDYKTNYLGQSIKDYNLRNLKKIMIQEQYDLQYKIYALGIKKILFKNIEKYNKNFGGIIYLFTRAFKERKKNQSRNQHGIYTVIPNFKELDLEYILKT
ncbi:exodeoxyribonuclease V subunit beta [Borrelia sp. A-FGy1]|uniref:exodeoxyribonuclease V subunit beta n=1 Tax=Borrelia sp. A-FGy1 TaxID=2608247 RepID=UPI0015F6E3EC|nr:exodeoxyribonuclease V subunit beta [Borrelia sp. A-FGy1]QMU99388.1 exodeoxyribonuclease V subunit beta [Borrelia sp. A-FGy1]